jgi:DeoR/GlpR family transcriptional regulator of sugar metabolism
MLAKDRHAAILNILCENNLIRIGEIAKEFDVSQETARRDLEILQEQNLVKRIHGGAILNTTRYNAPPADAGKGYIQAEKIAIGKKAAGMVRNGETIFLDIGTTVLEMARNLKNHHDLTIITYSLTVVNELMTTKNNIIMLGGEVMGDEQFVYSTDTEQMFDRFFVDKVFFSCGGVTFKDGVTDYGITMNRVTLAAHASEMVLLADSGKFGRNARYKTCPLDIINTIVVDSKIDEQNIVELENLEKRIIIAEIEI